MKTDSRVRRGFALIEAIVALAVAAFVLVAARAILESVADGADRLVEAAADGDRAGNADRLLRGLVGQVESATVVPNAVAGDERRVRIETWCDVPAGWKERCTVELGFVAHEDGDAFVAAGVPGGPLVLRGGVAHGALRYLVDPAHGGAWLSRWAQQVTTPLALGVILDGDTLILRIGERG